MRDLAVVANVSTSTLYNLYQSKDTLILVALEDLLTSLNEAVVATGAKGVNRSIRRIEGIAEQIVETPQYAEAMGKMLFTAHPSDAIVKALLGSALVVHQEELAEMVELGELRDGTDRDFLARSMASNGWSVILMWMKGYVPIADFRREYVRSAVSVLVPWLNDAAAADARRSLSQAS